ncbi:ABC transporter transmembrane domain-containing protein, partial [Roseovarius salis]|uniref:ABC transporter transmembrane domain-containing protein n=1 Tax=Roseovarius salis TaxID=3376063 RepID=UPI0037C94BAB
MPPPARRLSVARDELRAARAEGRALYWAVGLFSVFVNLLMLSGPLYMLQVYDRVLGSRSIETLVALSVLVVFLFAMMGVLDYARGRIMNRAAARFQSRLERRVFDAVMQTSAPRADARCATGLTDLESIRRFMASPVLLAFFDLPWTPVLLAGIFVFHPWLGALATTGGSVLVLFAILNQVGTRRPAHAAADASAEAEAMAGRLRAQGELVQAMGMRDAGYKRWQAARRRALSAQVATADLGGTFTMAARVFRLFLQSAMLGLGAYLVLQDELTAGAMIAGSILLGRALAPVEQAVAQWPTVQAAAGGWRNLVELLAAAPPPPARTALP